MFESKYQQVVVVVVVGAIPKSLKKYGANAGIDKITVELLQQAILLGTLNIIIIIISGAYQMIKLGVFFGGAC